MKKQKKWLKMLCAGMALSFVVGANTSATESTLKDENPYRLDEIMDVNVEGKVYKESESTFVFSKERPRFNDEEPIKVVNFRKNAEGTVVGDTTSYTEYLTGESGYTYGGYAADAAYLGTYDGKIRFMLSGVVGEVDESKVELVNLADQAVISMYKVENGRLIHYIARNMETEGYATYLDNGKAPSVLSSGTTYYSYDGHYFYTDYGTMLEDYKNGVRSSSVNPNAPYFNYYQYLPLRSYTVYTGSELTEVINAKIKSNYGEEKAATSKMLDMGDAFIEHQNTYGVNALITIGHAANESAWGTSNICQEKNNLFGLNATDSNPSEDAYVFESPEACIEDFADGWMSRGYLYPGDWRYYGGYLGDKAGGMNVKYASDPYWGEKAANHAYALDKAAGGKDQGSYTIGIKDLYPGTTMDNRYDVNVRNGSSTSATKLYSTGYSTGYSVIVRKETAENNFYQIQSDGVLTSDRSAMTKETGVYDANTMYAYISADYVKVVNNGTGSIVPPEIEEPAECEHNNLKEIPAKEPNCVNAGNYKYYTCSDCGELFDADVNPTTQAAQKRPALGHEWDEGTDKGIMIEYVCQRCDETKEETKEGSFRLAGDSRFETSFAIADALKLATDAYLFDDVIIANGNEFPDALAGSYLASVKNAPILLTNGKNADAMIAYLQKNMASNGLIYVLGGEKAVPESFITKIKSAMTAVSVERLSGADRYETNLAILQKAGVAKKDILVCTGNGFADSLSASAVKKPILLVGKKLTSAQKEFLDGLSGNNIFILGGTGVVNTTIEAELLAYDDSIERLAGENRYETSIAIANRFFNVPESIVLTSGVNFPDGLCGGPLAAYIGAPVILTTAGAESQAAGYVANYGIESAYVLGGKVALPDSTINAIFN